MYNFAPALTLGPSATADLAFVVNDSSAWQSLFVSDVVRRRAANNRGKRRGAR